VCEKDAIELLRCDAAMLETQHQLSRAQPAIDKNFAMIGCDQGAVSRAPAAEHGQAEHGSQVSRVSSVYANANKVSLRITALSRGPLDMNHVKN
jgi:hypothetical protein